MISFNDTDDGIQIIADEENTINDDRLFLSKSKSFNQRNNEQSEYLNNVNNKSTRNDSGVSSDMENSEQSNKNKENLFNLDADDEIDDDVFDNLEHLKQRIYIKSSNDKRQSGKQLKSFALEFEKIANMLNDLSNKKKKTKGRISPLSLNNQLSSDLKVEKTRANSRTRIPSADRYSDDNNDKIRLNTLSPTLTDITNRDFNKKAKISNRHYIPSATTTKSSNPTRNCYHTKIYKCPCIKLHKDNHITLTKRYHHSNADSICRFLDKIVENTRN